MLVEIERFVNWVRRRNPGARTWRDYGYDLRFFMEVVGDRPPNEITLQEGDRCLSAYLAERPSATCDFVFLSYQNKGLSTTSIHNCLLKYRQRAELQITAHRLRHSFATDLVNADAAVTSIQKLMGHRWLETTQLYIMANDKQVCEDYYSACQKLENWQILMEATSSHNGMLLGKHS